MTQRMQLKSASYWLSIAAAALACIGTTGLGCVEMNDGAKSPQDLPETPSKPEDETPNVDTPPDEAEPTEPTEPADLPPSATSIASSRVATWSTQQAGMVPGHIEFAQLTARVDALPTPDAAASFQPRATVDLWYQVTDLNNGSSLRAEIADQEPAQVVDLTAEGYALQMTDGTRIRITDGAAFVEQFGNDDLEALAAIGSGLWCLPMQGDSYRHLVQGSVVYVELSGTVYDQLNVAAVPNGWGSLQKRVGTDDNFVVCDLHEGVSPPICIYQVGSNDILAVSSDGVLRQAALTGSDAAVITSALLDNAATGAIANLDLACEAGLCTTRWWQSRDELLGLAN